MTTELSVKSKRFLGDTGNRNDKLKVFVGFTHEW